VYVSPQSPDARGELNGAAVTGLITSPKIKIATERDIRIVFIGSSGFSCFDGCSLPEKPINHLQINRALSHIDHYKQSGLNFHSITVKVWFRFTALWDFAWKRLNVMYILALRMLLAKSELSR
jgi:hypothetical protein